MLQRGEQVPHFTVRRPDGSDARYTDLWQRRNLVLVSLPDQAENNGRDAYERALAAKRSEFETYEADCIVTYDAVPGVPQPGVLVADRFGEITFIGGGSSVSELPDPDDIVEWVKFVQYQCPECQGEAR